MACGNCGKDNPDGTRFCRACGHSLATLCTNCQAPISLGDSFCGNCGQTTSAASPVHESTSPPTSEAEKRFVSVLFADIVAYTAFSEGRDPDEIRDLLTVYFDRARTIIEKFGGFVDKFIGDAVMGVWGAEATREDDCERAVRAALELVSMVTSLGKEQGHDGLQLRAGVNSGSTSVGPGGNEKGLVVGDLVNAAARLQSSAEPGTVFVGASTHEVTARSIVYESRGELHVKGKTELVEAWRAVRPAGRAGREVTTRDLPFTGRNREMRLLNDMLEATTAERRSRLVSITGEAGIGKSRLAREFMNHADSFGETIYWHQGRSPSYGDGLPMWAVGEMVRQSAGIAEDEEASRARTRLRTTLAEFVPDADDRRWIEGWLAGLLGLSDMPAGAGSELHSSIRTYFQHIAEQGTTVLVFEDLHWADGTVVEFIGDLVDRSTKSPILVLTLARPELLQRYGEFGSAQRASLSVSLAPLVDEDMTEMLTEHLPGVSDDVIAHIVARASGFPLYAAEIIRMLTNESSLVQDSDTWQFHGDADHLAVPDTLQAVIESRLDRLEPGQRAVLQDASVLGLSCTAAALTAIGHTEDLDATLRQLVQLELLEVEDDPRSPERGQYQFVQGVIREVAYGRLHRTDRRDRHLAAAEYYQSFDDPELAGVVSSHYQQAVEASPQGEHRDALQRQAIDALVTAADRSASLHADEQAMGLYGQSLTLATDKTEAANLSLLAARSGVEAGSYERALDYLSRAEDSFLETADREGQLRAATLRSFLHNSMFSPLVAVAAIEPWYLSLDEIDNEVKLGVAVETARGYMVVGRRAEAITIADRALPVANDLEQTRLIAELLVTRSSALAFSGRTIEGSAGLLGVLELSEGEGLLEQAMRAAINLIGVADRSNTSAGDALNSRLLELAERHGAPEWIVRAKVFAAGQAFWAGNWNECIDWIDQMAELATDQLWIDIMGSVRSGIDALRGDGAWQTWMTDIDSDESQGLAEKELNRALAATLAGDWNLTYEHALASGEVFWWTLPLAARAAVRLGDASLLELPESFVDQTSNGPARSALRALFIAARQAMTGETSNANQGFVALLGKLPGVAPDLLLIQIKLLFVESVGLEHPAAAQAAQEAADWIEATGTNGLLDSAPILKTLKAPANVG